MLQCVLDCAVRSHRQRCEPVFINASAPSMLSAWHMLIYSMYMMGKEQPRGHCEGGLEVDDGRTLRKWQDPR